MKLPLNCSVEYIGDFLEREDADELYQTLIERYEIDKAQLVIEAGGQMMETDSYKILFMTERLRTLNSHPENIHGKSYVWEGVMATLRERVEEMTNSRFELAMCLFYPNGTYFVDYHFDQQTSGHRTILPSISLGEVREFAFRENSSGEIHSMDLKHGSLLVMGDYCQNRYEHSLLKNSEYVNGRINITFRESSFQ